jgi:glucosamine-6-phosphate deaminase
VPIQVHVHPNDSEAAEALARRVAAAVSATPNLVVGLPTGRTPIPFYRALVALVARGDLSLAGVTTFNLDEFVGLPPSHPGSYRQFMEEHLFGHVDIPREQVNFLHGETDDLEAECERYEAAIDATGGIDIQILGLGTNGHIGFNEPAGALEARTHRVVLEAETRRNNASLFGGDPSRVPREALSMGMATILHARSIVLLATGKRKAACVERLLNGPITTRLPASFLQIHPAVDVVLDEEAAASLVRR